MLTVLGLAGSPRRGGNSELLLDRALAGASEAGGATEKIILNELDIRPCQHCDGCLHNGLCIIDDDFQSIHGKLKEADRIILSVPIFFMSLTAQAKLVIDRCQALWVAKYILGERHTLASDGSRRRGLWISLGGRNRPLDQLFSPARATVRAFFATLDLEYGEELLYPAVDGYREVLRHPTALDEAYQAGRRLVPPPARPGGGDKP